MKAQLRALASNVNVRSVARLGIGIPQARTTSAFCTTALPVPGTVPITSRHSTGALFSTE